METKKSILTNFAQKRNLNISEFKKIKLKVKWPSEIDGIYNSTSDTVELDGVELQNGYTYVIASTKEAYETLQKCSAYQFKAEVEQMGLTMGAIVKKLALVQELYIMERLGITASTKDDVIFKKLPEYLFLDFREDLTGEEDNFCIYSVTPDYYR